MDTTSLLTKNSVAPIKSRVFACLIDLSFFLLAFLVANFVLPRSHDNPLSILGVCVSIAIILGATAYQITLLASTGQTVGKRVMRLRIVALIDASNPGFAKTVLVRCWLPAALYAIPYLGWVFCVADNLFVFKADHRCLRDLMAGTKVVQVTTDEHSARSA